MPECFSCVYRAANCLVTASQTKTSVTVAYYYNKHGFVKYYLLKPHLCIMNKSLKQTAWALWCDRQCFFNVSTGRHQNIHAVTLVEEDVQGEGPPRRDLRFLGNVTCQLPCLGHLHALSDPEEGPE